MTRCPQCHGADFGGKGKTDRFVLSGVEHTAPNMWMAGAALRGRPGKLGYLDAMRAWAKGCELSALTGDGPGGNA